MNAWLITGGAGFIGSNFVRLASSRVDAKLIVLDALTYAGNLSNINDLIESKQITFIKGNILDSTLLNQLFSEHKISHVVHFAAESHVDRSITGPAAFIETNVTGTYTLLKAAQDAWQNQYDHKRFLHVSTDEVYGDLGPDDPPFNERMAYQPSSPYSASKAASDHLAMAWHRTYGLPVIISNCSNNYGPWQFPEKLIPLIILNALEGRELPVYGDGMQIRDWLHVEDHCDALFTILERGQDGEIYCIGGNNERTNLDIVMRICNAVDQALYRTAGASRKLISHVTDRLGHDRRYAIDAGKLRQELHWSPSYTVENALPEVVNWYLQHRDWADDVRSGEYQAYYERHYNQR